MSTTTLSPLHESNISRHFSKMLQDHVGPTQDPTIFLSVQKPNPFKIWKTFSFLQRR